MARPKNTAVAAPDAPIELAVNQDVLIVPDKDDSGTKRGTYREMYKVADDGGILNHNGIALADAALRGRFSASDLNAIGADIEWLLVTGQIERDGIEVID